MVCVLIIYEWKKGDNREIFFASAKLA